MTSTRSCLEDDYDSEFRYDGRPVESLQGLDGHGRVVYAGSASKLMFPSLRIGWLVVPPALVDPFLRAKAVADTGTPGLEQLALAEFIAQGHLERHVRRQRTRNGERRAVLLDAVERHLGSRATVQGAEAGVHVVLWLQDVPAAHEPAIRRACREEGVAVYPLAPAYAEPPHRAGFILGYASLRTEAIERGMAVLAQAVEQVTGRRCG